MRTDELVHTLSADVAFVPERPLAPRLLIAVAIALVAWLALMIPMYGMPATAAPHGWFWMKNVYSVVLALAGLVAVTRLARPGGRMGWAAWLALAAIAFLAVMAMRETMMAPPGQMARLWLGNTWTVCAEICSSSASWGYSMLHMKSRFSTVSSFWACMQPTSWLRSRSDRLLIAASSHWCEVLRQVSPCCSMKLGKLERQKLWRAAKSTKPWGVPSM